MKDNFFVVVSFQGERPTQNVLKSVASALSDVATADLIKINVLTSKDVSEIVTNKHIATVEDKPADHAGLLIGTVYYNVLKENNLTEFSSKLSMDLAEAKFKQNNSALINAVEILCREVPSKSIRLKYHITDKVLSVIKFVYNMVKPNY